MSKSTSADRNALETRQTYFKHEGAILATGQLFYLMALGLILAALTGVVLHSWRGVLSWPDTVWVAGVFVFVAALYAWVGYGFRTLATLARYGAGGLALLCLSSVIINPAVQHPLVLVVALVRFFAMPVGVILTGYGAWIALSKKGGKVFSAEYRQVIVNTPRVDFVFSKLFLIVGSVLITVQSLKVLTVFIK